MQDRIRKLVAGLALAVAGPGFMSACQDVPTPIEPGRSPSASATTVAPVAADMAMLMRQKMRQRTDAEFADAFEKGNRVVTIGFKPDAAPWGVDDRGNVLVSDAEIAQRFTYITSLATRVLRRFTTIPAITVELPSVQIAQALRRLPWVDYVAESTQLLTPDDVSVQCFDASNNNPPRGTASAPEAITWNLTRVGADQAWSIATGVSGLNQDLSVLDDGADEQQANIPLGPELANAGVYAWYVAASPNDGYHGTETLGAASARRNNGVGVAGVAPDARTRVLKIYDRYGAQNWDYYSAFAIDGSSQFSWVMSESYSTKQTDPAPPTSMAPMYDAIKRAYYNYGTVIVASTGNQSQPLYAYPAAFPEVVGVGGSGYGDEWELNNYAPGNVEISAPALDVGTVCKGGQTGTATGTSFATPMVAGAFMLLHQSFPADSPAQLRSRMTTWAVPMSDPQKSGAGRMDIYAALTH